MTKTSVSLVLKRLSTPIWASGINFSTHQKPTKTLLGCDSSSHSNRFGSRRAVINARHQPMIVQYPRGSERHIPRHPTPSPLPPFPYLLNSSEYVSDYSLVSKRRHQTITSNRVRTGHAMQTTRPIRSALTICSTRRVALQHLYFFRSTSQRPALLSFHLRCLMAFQNFKWADNFWVS